MTNHHPPLGAGPSVPRSPSARGLERANPWLSVIFNERKRRIRILIVADGDVNFTTGDFGLSELIHKGILPSATPWEDLIVVTAHRSEKETGADIPNFKFNVTPPKPFAFPFTIEDYEQVWLFGYNRGNKDPLPDPELAVLAAFMQAGGGVFATGDHEELGAALCGEVPRVRSMRKWFTKDGAPGLKNETRIDTLREGIDPGFRADDESDRVAQEIRPRFKKAEGCKRAEPHPLLAHGERAISVLPDHMHEGECLVPDNLCRKFSFDGADPSDEFPRLGDDGPRLAPEVVAIATSAAGGYLEGVTCFPPVEPRCFNVIVAYDGHQVGVGRVAVDASFHHFLNINLKGAENGDVLKKGFYDAAGNPTEEYIAIKQYYRNLVLWLCRPKVRYGYYMNMLLGLRYLSPLIEELPVAGDAGCDDVLVAGILTHNAISERFSRFEATQCALALAPGFPETFTGMVMKLTDPWLPPALSSDEQLVLLNAEVLPKVILGSVMQGIVETLPNNSYDVSEALTRKELEGARLQDFTASNMARGVAFMETAVDKLLNAVSSFSAALRAFHAADEQADEEDAT